MNRPFIRFGAVCAVAVLSACAPSPDVSVTVPTTQWRLLGVSTSGVSHSLDIASIRRNGDKGIFTDRKTATHALPAAVIDAGIPNFRTAISQWEIDCRKKTFRLLAARLTDANGKTLMQGSSPNITAQPIAPGSVSALQYDIVCRP